jgi:HEAT repeat protein
MRKPTGSSTNLPEHPGVYKADIQGEKEMKNQIKAVYVFLFLVIVVIFGLFQSPGWASDINQAAESDVQALVDRFPAQNTEARQGLASQLMGMGSDGILAVCRLLLPPGTGDDTNARYALSALATYVSQEGGEKARELYAKTLVKALKGQNDKEVQAFLIRQLQKTGKRESIKPLKDYLEDKRLCEPATQALLAIGTPEAEKVLLKALDKKAGTNRITLIKALGELKSQKATKKILPYAADKNDEMRQVALFALANIGDPLAEKAVSSVSLKAPSYERTRAPSLYLLYAQRLSESGHKMQCAGICRNLIVKYTAPQESHIPCTALSLLVDAVGESAFEDLLQAMDSPNRELRARALELADRIPGEEATARWIERMEDVPPDVQAQIIGMLGRRGDVTALPVIREKLKSHRKVIKLASIPAVARLGGEEVFFDILSLLRTDQKDEIAVVKQALLGFPSPLLIPESVKMLDKVPTPSRVALIEILSERHAKDHADVLFAKTDSKNEDVRRAALAGLVNLAGPQDLPRLIAMLVETDRNQAIRLIQAAIVASANQIEDKEKRADLLIEAMQDAAEKKQPDLLRPLSRIGGQNALQAVIAKTRSENLQVQTVAISVLADWPDFEAAEELSRIWRNTESPKFLLVAVRGYVRLIHESDMAPESRLKRYKDVLGLVSYPAAKAIVLSRLGSVRSLEAFKIAVSFLEHPELRSQAAAAVARIGFSGLEIDKVYSKPQLLSLSQKVARDIRDDRMRQSVDNRIGDLLKEEGFVPLFNRRDLTGWKGLVGDPVKRAKMTPEEMAKAQALADESMHVHWKVRDGILVFDGRGESLCTVEDYKDFEMFVDWKIEEGGDSGIYLRGSPQVQIWGPDQSPEGSGGLYNNQKHPRKPLVRVDNPVGEWNTFYIKMIGERVTVYLNGVLVVDDVVMENYWERDKPIYPLGQIELQAHNTPLYFRNIYIREIPREEQGFVSLFNGQDLKGWVGDRKGYGVEDGKIVVFPARGGGNLYTEKEYSDFVLRFEFKLTSGANNGLGIRAPLEGDAAYAGMELQILDNTAEKYKDLESYQYHGSIYGVVPAKRGHLKPAGEWNEQEVIADGRRISVKLNGVVIVDANIDLVSTPKTMDGREHPGLKRERGHIGFLGHGSRVEFRNIRIKELR